MTFYETIKNGAVHSGTSDAVWGDADHPLSDDDLKNKFLTLSQESVTLTQAEELIDMIWGLEEFSSIKKLISILHKYASS